MKNTAFYLSAIFIFVIGCKTTPDKLDDGATHLKDSPMNSDYLADAGDNAKVYFYNLIKERNSTLRTAGAAFKFEVMDARDPRLYAPGSAIQPPTPAEKAIVKVADNGQFVILALLIDRPGILMAKEFPTGNKIITIEYGVERIAYSSRFDGLYGSVIRNTSGNGWYYIYYLLGLGNNVNAAMFDSAIARFLQTAVVYMTPITPRDPRSHVWTD